MRQRLQTEIIRNKQSSYIGETLNFFKKKLPIFDIGLTRNLYNENGIKTFFRGTNITLIKNVQMAFLLPAFERFSNGRDSNLEIAIAASAAKIISSTAVYPLDVIRTNVRYYEGQKVKFWNVTKDIWSKPGGALNFFRGIHWYWISSASMFSTMMVLQKIFEQKIKK